MLGNSVVVVVVVRTRPRAIPLAKITMRKSIIIIIIHLYSAFSTRFKGAVYKVLNSWVSFIFPLHDEYGAPLGGPSGRRSSANTIYVINMRQPIKNNLCMYIFKQ